MHSIIPMDDIEKFVNEIRQNRGEIKIVFTNGIFDIIHRGHITYLEKAKDYGDILILGLNSDSSAKRLKGSDRPIVNQDDRAYILSRMEPVDIVSIFNEDTPINLIRKVKPDILIKGGDYELEGIVGREFVESYGGIVNTIPFVEGKSTSGLIEKIRKL